jgi:hypothetical protein
MGVDAVFGPDGSPVIRVQLVPPTLFNSPREVGDWVTVSGGGGWGGALDGEGGAWGGVLDGEGEGIS